MLKLSIAMQKAQIKFSTNFIDNLISENGEFMTLLTESYVTTFGLTKNLFANPATDPKTINLQNSIAEIKKSVITYINNMYQTLDILNNNSESMSSHESDFETDNVPVLEFQPDNMDDNIADIQIQTRQKRKLSDSDIQIQTRQKSKKRKLNHKEKKSKQKKKKWRKQLEKTKKREEKESKQLKYILDNYDVDEIRAQMSIAKNEIKMQAKKERMKTKEKIGSTIKVGNMHYGVFSTGMKNHQGRYECCLNFDVNGNRIYKDLQNKIKYCNAKPFSYPNRDKHQYRHIAKKHHLELPKNHPARNYVPNCGCVCKTCGNNSRIYTASIMWNKHKKDCVAEAMLLPNQKELPKFAKE